MRGATMLPLMLRDVTCYMSALPPLLHGCALPVAITRVIYAERVKREVREE